MFVFNHSLSSEIPFFVVPIAIAGDEGSFTAIGPRHVWGGATVIFFFHLLPGGKEPAWRCRWVKALGINNADKSMVCLFYMGVQTPTTSGSCIKYTFWSMCPDRVHGTQSSLLQWAVNALRIGVPRASCQSPSALQEKLMNKAGCFRYRQTMFYAC